jgi:hypothetical protein
MDVFKIIKSETFIVLQRFRVGFKIVETFRGKPSDYSQDGSSFVLKVDDINYD